MKSLKKSIFALGLFISLQFLAVSPVFAQTSAWEGVCIETRVIEHENEADEIIEVATIQGFQCVLANVLSVFLTVVGLAAFIMLIAASFRILLSGGNSQSVEKAKNSVTYAIIGLIVAVSAFVILNLISQFTGVETILNFQIPGPEAKHPLP